MKQWKTIKASILLLLIVFLSVCFDILPQKTNNNNAQNFNRVESATANGIKVEFVGLNGELVTPFGNYSTVYKVIDASGNLIVEKFYYGNIPVTSQNGQYANRYDYDEDGNQSVITFLNQDGTPMNGNNGYAITKRSFYPDGSIRDEMYYDIGGHLVEQSKGNYGIRHVNQKIYYLDSSGRVMFDINLFFSYNHWIVIAGGMSICLVICILNKKNSLCITMAMLVLVIFETLLRGAESRGMNLELFWSYKQFFTNHNLRVQILNNMWLFIPLGAGIRAILCKKRYLFLPLLLSLFIEITQYFFHLGLCELDDIMSNTLGGCVGYFIADNFKMIINEIRKVKQRCC